MKKIVQTSQTESDETHSLDTAVMLLTDDGDLSTAPSGTGFPSEVYVYIGEKAKAGHPIEQAGFTSVGVFMDCRLF